MPGIGNAIGIPFKKGGGISWSSYCTPSDLTLTILSSTSIKLDWLYACSGEDGFVIERSTDGITFADVDTVAAGVLTFTDTGLTAGDLYYYRVRAYKGVIESPPEEEEEYLIENTELTTYITGLATELSDAQLERLDDLITALKTALSIADLDDGFDGLWILAGETEESSLKNLAKNAHHATKVNTPDWVQYEGFTGNGTDEYLNSNYNPKTQGSAFTLNSGSLGIYSRTNTLFGQTEIGARAGVLLNRTFLNVRYDVAGTGYSAIYINTNDSSNGRTSGAVADGSGMTIGSRLASNITRLYRNGAQVALIAETSASSDFPNFNLFIGALNNAGSVFNPSHNQIAVAFVSSGIAGANIAAVTNAFEAYMDANGKGVI